MQKDGTLSVPDVPVVPYITGDGVGGSDSVDAVRCERGCSESIRRQTSD